VSHSITLRPRACADNRSTNRLSTPNR
jgi:hypothetical protein